MVKDLLHPSATEEKRKHKLKRLVQSPNSFFMDVKCPGCFNITTVFSHAQTVVLCGSCSMMLCQPTGGRARLTEGCSFRKKVDSRSPLLHIFVGRRADPLVAPRAAHPGPRTRPLGVVTLLIKFLSFVKQATTQLTCARKGGEHKVVLRCVACGFSSGLSVSARLSEVMSCD